MFAADVWRVPRCGDRMSGAVEEEREAVEEAAERVGLGH